MDSTYHVIADIDRKSVDQSLNDIAVADIAKHSALKRDLFSLTTLRPHSDGWLYVGTTNFANRILWRFNPEKAEFEELHYERVGTHHDIKIHRSLEWDRVNRVLYGVSSGLHNEDQYFDAPGAEIFAFNPETLGIETLGVPLPHEYTQTITFDPERRLLYGFTYHTFSFYVFHVDRRETLFHALPNSISHISALDDDGCIWSTWGRDQHYLFKYDPAVNAIQWTRKKFPEGGHSYMYPGAGPIDCMLNAGDGKLYVALETGALVSMDPQTMAMDYLGRPAPAPRMPALIQGPDGFFYGTCGDDWNVQIFSFDPATRGFRIIAPVAAEDGKRCFRPHDLAFMEDRFFVAETDNPERSGYLWEIRI